VDNGEVLMVGDGYGVLDDVRGFAVRSRVRSERSNASCSDGEQRLETAAGEDVTGVHDLCEKRSDEGIR
jgi:hypothetical protein